MFDFSSAFDAIDHSTILCHLHADFGFTDTAPQLFFSYLHTVRLYLFVVLLLFPYIQVFLYASLHCMQSFINATVNVLRLNDNETIHNCHLKKN